MKILMLTYRGNPFCGGQGVYISFLAEELVRQGHQVHCISGPPYPLPMKGVTTHLVEGIQSAHPGVVYPPQKAPLSAFSPINFLEKCLAVLGRFPEMTTFSFRAFLKVRHLLAQEHFDVILDNQTLGWGLLPMKLLGVPLVATIHHPLTIDRARGFDPPTSFSKQFWKMMFYPIFMQRVVSKRMPHVVTVSEASAQSIREDFGVPSSKISVVYNGVNTDQFRPMPSVPRVPGRILFVGSIEDPNKGGIFLLRSMTHVQNNAHLVIVTGNVTPDGWVYKEIEKLGLKDKITIHTQLSSQKVVEMYATAEVAVSSSVFEGFGLPAAEAMACEVPVVAARGGALPEVVGDAGVLVPARDSEALAEAFNHLLSHPEERTRLGKAARKRVLARFQWKSAATEMVGIFQDAMNAHR